MLKKAKNQKGFTLIELIVVLAILGIIALIAIPRFAGIQQASRLKADNATASQIVNTAKIIAADLDVTPADAVRSYPGSGDWKPAKDPTTGVLSNTGTTVYMTIPAKTQSVPTAGFGLSYADPTYTVSGPSTSYTSN